VRLAVFAIYFTLPAVALSALPVEDGVTQLGVPSDEGGYADAPIRGVVENTDLGPMQGFAEAYVGILAATILVVATNAAIIGVSRLVYSMGIYRQLPDRMRRLHPRYGTPWIGILLCGVIAVVALLPGQADFLANMYAFGAMLSFTVAHAAVLVLRLKEPDRDRPYRGPGNLRIAGRDVPLFAVVGGTGTGLAFVVVTVLNPEVAATGIGWLVLGMAVYLVFRRRQGLDLTTTRKVAIPAPVVDREAEYESVLVALDGRAYSPGAMATAARMAAMRRRGIFVLVPIVVPQSSPINAEMPEQELAAQAILEQARLQGGRRVTGRWHKVRAGQEGRLIVDQARALRARAIVLSLPARNGGGAVFGRTAETVLSERPCRVIVQADPAAEPSREPDRVRLARST
jgi:APA family basic amino acid/polyamine antiporter